MGCSQSVPSVKLPLVEGAIRILCLHGDGTNDKVTKIQMQPLIDALHGIPVEFIYVNGPQPVEYIAAGLKSSKMTGKQMYRWFEWDSNQLWPDVHDAIASIPPMISGNAPIHGVVGFSQGGGICAMIAALAQRGDICNTESLRFAILMNAPQYFPMKESYVTALLAEDKPLTVPSLHTYGETDPHLKYIKQFMPFFKGPQELAHSGGHQPFPTDQQESIIFANKIAAFIKQQCKP